MGYLGEEKKTREVIDDKGWLHSGDLGWLDDVSIHIVIMHISCKFLFLNG